jgi:nicotinamidase-related amidase
LNCSNARFRRVCSAQWPFDSDATILDFGADCRLNGLLKQKMEPDMICRNGISKLVAAGGLALAAFALHVGSPASAQDAAQESAQESVMTYPAATTAVIMIDPYNDFISEGGKVWPRVQPVAESVNLVENLKKLAEGIRAKGGKVVYAPHRRWREGDFENWKFPHPTHQAVAQYQVFADGTWGGEFHPDLTPQKGDAVAEEHWLSSGFANTDLDYQLRKQGIDHVIVVGLATNTCVESTGRYAVEMGYHTTFLSDAVATFSAEEQKSAIELDYPRIAHNVTTVDSFLAALQ